MDMALTSLLVFIGVIALAFILKVNTGLLAIIAAVVLAVIQPPAGGFFSLFDGKMFLMLMGVMYLFGIAEENSTLDLLAKKVINLCGGKVRLLPLLLFLLAAVISGIGPGPISATALMAVIAVALAKQVGIHPLKLLPFGALGAFATGLTPLTPSGIVAINNATKSNIAGFEWPLMWQMALVFTLYSVILYFFVFKWHKVKAEGISKQEKTAPFNWKQWATLAGILLTAVLAIVLKDNKVINVGIIALAIGMILTIMGAAGESKVLKRIPWGTLILIVGVGMLISMVDALGGIDLLQSWLKPLMNSFTANPIMTILAGAMSWFSSASGVVMPTLIPVSSELAAEVSGLDAATLSVGVCIGAHFAAISPMSTCGGLMLAAYSSGDSVDDKARNKMFIQLFVISACGVLFSAVAMILLGLF